MKKILISFVLFSWFCNAQFTIKGSLEPINNHNWVLLYKVEGAKQTFIKNASLKKETKIVGDKPIEIGSFEFEIPKEEEKGVFRITYDLKNSGFADVLFNKENIDVVINPNMPQIGLIINSSRENELYQNYSNTISNAQYQLDSLQVAYLKAPSETIALAYQKALKNLSQIQLDYETQAQNTFALDFIKASKRYNSKNVQSSYDSYVKDAVNHFFDYINFESENLWKSSFVVDRIADYVFYMNFAQEENQKQLFYKRSSDIAIGKINNIVYKADVIEFLIAQFAALQNTELVNYLFANQFDKLPTEKQDKDFKKKILEQLVTAIGNSAPDFSWEENGKTIKLSELTDGQNYLLIFYSTGCSHCLREVPQVYEFLKGKTQTKVIAFAMEEDDKTWKNYKKQFPEWHNVLGLKKWENEVARTYQINSTPTYFVLGADKKIIANPEKLEDLKTILTQLN